MAAFEQDVKASSTQIKAIGAGAKLATNDIAALAKPATDLKGAFSNTSSMLDTLNRLIASVRRYVEPGVPSEGAAKPDGAGSVP